MPPLLLLLLLRLLLLLLMMWRRRLGSGRYYPHRHPTHLSPGLLSEMASFDEARVFGQTLADVTCHE